MKKNIILMALSILLGIAFTFFVLNKENTFAKEEYLVYAFQVGAFEKEENAEEYGDKLPSSIIIKEKNLYKVYVSMFKDIDTINKMVVYFENNNINVYLKNINVNKEFYNILTSYEEIINNSEDDNVYNKVNQSILNSYLESLSYE